MSATMDRFLELAPIFAAALDEDRGRVITLISELDSEAKLVHLIEAAQMLDAEGNDYGDAWHGWNGSQQALDPDEMISLPGDANSHSESQR